MLECLRIMSNCVAVLIGEKHLIAVKSAPLPANTAAICDTYLGRILHTFLLCLCFISDDFVDLTLSSTASDACPNLVAFLDRL
jgi:hypothetical protein